MKPTVISGTVFSQLANSDDRPVDMDPHLYLLDGDLDSTFEIIVRKIGGKKAKNQMYYQSRRREIEPCKINVTTAAAAGASQIVVDDYTYVHRNNLIYVPATDELLMFSTAVGTATSGTLDIVSLSHTTPGTAALVEAIPANTEVLVLGEAHEEGVNIPEASTTKSTTMFDYIQQKDKRAAHLTDVEMNSLTYDEANDERTLQNKLATIAYMRDMALLFYVNKPARDVTSTTASARRQTFGGLMYKIQTNRFNMGDPVQAWTPAAVGAVLRLTTNHGQGMRSKVLLVGQNAAIAMSAWPKDNIRDTLDGAKKWGVPRITTVMTTWGDIPVTQEPLLTEEYGLADRAFIIDPSDLNEVFMRNMGLTLIKKVPDLSTTHVIVDAITSTFGLEGRLEELHAQWSGIKAT